MATKVEVLTELLKKSKLENAKRLALFDQYYKAVSKHYVLIEAVRAWLERPHSDADANQRLVEVAANYFVSTSPPWKELGLPKKKSKKAKRDPDFENERAPNGHHLTCDCPECWSV